MEKVWIKLPAIAFRKTGKAFLFTIMRRSTIGLMAFLCFGIAFTTGILAYDDAKDESEFVKSFRDPDRVDERWLVVTGFGTASACMMLWLYKRRTSKT